MHGTHSLAGLKAARLHANITREAAAETIGVMTTSYDRYENGTRIITFDKACRLADLIGVSLDTLRHAPIAVPPPPPPPGTDTVVERLAAGWSEPE